MNNNTSPLDVKTLYEVFDLFRITPNNPDLLLLQIEKTINENSLMGRIIMQTKEIFEIQQETSLETLAKELQNSMNNQI